MRGLWGCQVCAHHTSECERIAIFLHSKKSEKEEQEFKPLSARPTEDHIRELMYIISQSISLYDDPIVCLFKMINTFFDYYLD